MDLTNLIKQSFRKWLEALHTTVKEIYIFYFNIRSIYLSIKFLHEHCHHDNAPLIFQLFLAYFFKTPLQSNIDPLSVIYNHTLRLGCLWDDGRMKEKGGVHFCHFFYWNTVCEFWTLVWELDTGWKEYKKIKNLHELLESSFSLSANSSWVYQGTTAHTYYWDQNTAFNTVSVPNDWFTF